MSAAPSAACSSPSRPGATSSGSAGTRTTRWIMSDACASRRLASRPPGCSSRPTSRSIDPVARTIQAASSTAAQSCSAPPKGTSTGRSAPNCGSAPEQTSTPTSQGAVARTAPSSPLSEPSSREVGEALEEDEIGALFQLPDVRRPSSGLDRRERGRPRRHARARGVLVKTYGDDRQLLGRNEPDEDQLTWRDTAGKRRRQRNQRVGRTGVGRNYEDRAIGRLLASTVAGRARGRAGGSRAPAPVDQGPARCRARRRERPRAVWYAASASACLPERYNASICWARNRSRRGCSATRRSISPHELGVSTELQLARRSALSRATSLHLLQSCDPRLRKLLVRERSASGRSSPQAERLPQRLDIAAPDQRLESRQVELVGIDPHRVARRARLDPVRTRAASEAARRSAESCWPRCGAGSRPTGRRSSRSADTTSFGCVSRRARTARGRAPPRGTGVPSTTTSSGPRIRNSISASCQSALSAAQHPRTDTVAQRRPRHHEASNRTSGGTDSSPSPSRDRCRLDRESRRPPPWQVPAKVKVPPELSDIERRVEHRLAAGTKSVEGRASAEGVAYEYISDPRRRARQCGRS